MPRSKSLKSHLIPGMVHTLHEEASHRKKQQSIQRTVSRPSINVSSKQVLAHQRVEEALKMKMSFQKSLVFILNKKDDISESETPGTFSPMIPQF